MIHLHNHSDYSLLDGFGKCKKIIKRAKELGMSSIALTDHAIMSGIPEFHQYAIDNKVKPILGVELYLAYDHTNHSEDVRYHILLLAKNKTGYNNLLRLTNIANKEGFYYKPRVDLALIKQYHEGIITTSGCMASQVNQYLLNFIQSGDLAEYDKAKSVIATYVEIFGKDSYYIELQEHNIPELTQINQQLIQLAKYFGLKCVLTNDSHYVYANDARQHQAVLCIQTGSTLSNPTFAFSDDGYYIKDDNEMIATFAGYDNDLINEGMMSTYKIAEMVDEYAIKPEGYQIPKFSETPNEDLVALCQSAMASRGLQNNKIYVDRLNHELAIIKQMNFADYFLIIADLCAYAKNNKILFNARGSGAGSLVSWLLNITAPNPIQYGLLFERFLNPHRVNMPDIDLDFSERHTICQYIVNRYGSEYVAQISTFAGMKIKGGFKDFARVNDVPFNVANEISKQLMSTGNPDDDIALDEARAIAKGYQAKSALVPEVMEQAIKAMGIIRQGGVHAAGILITPKPLVEYSHHIHKKDLLKGIEYLSHLDMKQVEEFGLLKVDVLGLETLTIMAECIKLVNARHNKNYTFGNLPIEHESIFKLLATTNLDGVFQVEGQGISQAISKMKPSKVEHIIALLSLYRPATMNYIATFIDRLHGVEDVAYDHPLVENILKETFGIMVYQEQVTQILSSLAGFTTGEADMIRRAIGKKKPEIILANRGKFLEGCKSNNVSQSVAQKVWDDIVFFAGYGFNKSHSTSYALLTAKTAYLKANYQLEWYTCLLNHCKKEDKQRYLTNAQKNGIKILPPSFNSQELFTIHDDCILFGLAGVKHLGKSAYKTIRKLGSLEDALSSGLDKRILEALLYAGMLDNGDIALRYRLSKNVEFLQATKKFGLIQGNLDLFMPMLDIDYEGVDYLEKMELEYLGMTLQDNDLMLQVNNTIYGEDYQYGKITKLEPRFDKNNNQMAFIWINDERFVVFSRQWLKLSHIKQDDHIAFKTAKENIIEDIKILPLVRPPLPFSYSMVE